MLDWKLFYDKGATYSSADGEWEDAPQDGVLILVVRDIEKVWGRWVYSGYSPDKKAINPHLDCRAIHFPPGTEFFLKLPSEEPSVCYDLRPALIKAGLPDVLLLSYDEQITLARTLPWVKFGRMADQRVWQDAQSRAIRDPDFPVGSPRRRASDFQ